MKEKQFNELCELAKQVTGHDIRINRSRKKELVQIKCAVINVMRKYQSTSTVMLASLMGIHHTTIIHYTKDHPSRYRWEDDYAMLYDKMVHHVMEKSEIISVDQMMSLMKTALSVPEL
jgi:hypothetical protein